MKKLIAIILTFALVLPIVQPLTALAHEYLPGDMLIPKETMPSEINIQEALEEERELTEEEFDALIGLFERYVFFRRGEIFVNQSGINGLSDMLGAEIITSMIEGIENLNELAQQGEIIITENGTIFEASDDEFVLQSNINRRTWHWWGVRELFSRATTSNWIHRLEQARNTAAAVTAISGLTGFLPGSVAGIVTMWYTQRLATDMRFRLNSTSNRGIVVEMTWILAYRTKVQ